MNGIFLFRGMTPSQLNTLFEYLGLRGPHFSQDDFVELYQKYSGDKEDDLNEKEKFKYNYLFIETDPKSMIMLNLKDKLK